MALLIVFGFLLGLAVGSFLNVVILRGAREEKISGRSRCETCGKTLAWYELIPLLSFAFQKGRCRTCGAALSWQYPLVELGTGFIFASVGWYFFIPTGGGGKVGGADYSDLLLSFILYLLSLVILSSSIVIFVSDLRWKIIPNGAVLILLLSGIALRLLSYFFPELFLPLYGEGGGIYVASQTFPPLAGEGGLSAGRQDLPAGQAGGGVTGVILSASEAHLLDGQISLLWDFSAAFLIALFFAAIWFVTRGRGMGFGDAKLVLATSVILGFPESIVAALLSFWIGAAVGIFLILLRLKSWKDQIPFGPYILVGAALAYFFTAEFIQILSRGI